jgi:hypothetical protein
MAKECKTDVISCYTEFIEFVDLIHLNVLVWDSLLVMLLKQ